MALTTKSDGTGAPNLVTHTWWDDYYDLLTGSMHDQPVTLDYRPGAGTTPTLVLKGDGSGKLIRGYKTDDTTEAFSVDSSGNLSLAGGATASGGAFNNTRALSGASQSMLHFAPSDGTKIWNLYYNTDGSMNFYNSTDSKAGPKILTSGGLDDGVVSGAHYAIIRSFGTGVTSPGRQIWIVTGGTDPVAADGLADGDVVLTY